MSEKNIIRVMIVDDHDMVRSGLVMMLEAFDDLELVGEASDGEIALQLCQTLDIDVILMDLVMPRMDGVTTIRKIHAAYPAIQIIALTTFKEQDLVKGALQAGAISYLLKNVPIEELATAIRDAQAGKATLAPEAADILISAVTQPSPPGDDLTEREREILALLVEGLSNQDIGDHLMISHSTVKNHVSNILSKLNAANRVEAVALALKHNIIQS